METTVNETIIKVRETNGSVQILMSKDAQTGNRPDQVTARNLVQIAQKAADPKTMQSFQQFRQQFGI
ncbi:MAG: hypothetical protein IKK25_03565 [Lentisphaeria bacterium]|nr:hypothetical protein [Lentisphaeria bacterium]